MTLILNNKRPITNNPSCWQLELQRDAENLVSQFQEQISSTSSLSNPEIYLKLIQLIQDEGTPEGHGILPLQRAIVQAAFEILQTNLNTNVMTQKTNKEPVMMPISIETASEIKAKKEKKTEKPVIPAANGQEEPVMMARGVESSKEKTQK